MSASDYSKKSEAIFVNYKEINSWVLDDSRERKIGNFMQLLV